MTILNSFSMRDNAPKLVPGAKWRTRAKPHKVVEIVAVTFSHVTMLDRNYGRADRKKKEKLRMTSRYGFLQVFVPLESKEHEAENKAGNKGDETRGRKSHT